MFVFSLSIFLSFPFLSFPFFSFPFLSFPFLSFLFRSFPSLLKTQIAQQGYLTADIVKKFMPEPSDDNLVMVCGPPPFMKVISGEKVSHETTSFVFVTFICSFCQPTFLPYSFFQVSPQDQGEVAGFLKDLSYTKEQVFKF